MTTLHRRHPLAATALALAASLATGHAQAQASPRFTLETLPTLGGTAGSASAVNDAGQVVGTARNSLGIHRAYVWQQDVGIVTMPGSVLQSSSGTAINERGQVAGNFGSLTLLYGRAFVWTPGGTVTDVPPVDDYFQVLGINDSGVVVGAGDSLDGWARVPMLWSVPTGTLRLVPSIPGGHLNAINNGGQMVGNLYLGEAFLPVYWTHRTSQQFLVDEGLPGLGDATALNNLGQVAGVHSSSGAFTWSAAAGARALQGEAERVHTPRGINDAGLVVGEWADNDGRRGAVAWRPDGSLVDLSALTGVALTAAPDANNRGQIVVNGEDRAHLLTLHPDWVGGNGSWAGSAGAGGGWNFAGLGAAGAVGAVHEVIIDPGISATVQGALRGQAQSLRVGGTAGQVVVLDLNGGTTQVATRTSLDEGGVLRGHGRHQGDVSVGSGARIEVGAGQTLQLAGDLAQQGVVDLRASGGVAQFQVTGSWSARGQTHLLNAELRADGGMVNQGLLHISGFSQVLGVVDNRSDGRIQVSGSAGEAVFWDELVNEGVVTVTSGSTATFFGLVRGSGSFGGAGTKHFAGGYEPGSSPGLATLAGAVVFDGGTIQMELAGPAEGSEHDKLVFDGALVSLTGGVVLDVVLLDGYAPALGDQFDLFDWNGSLAEGAGRFSLLRLPALAGDLAWDVSRLYLDGDIRVAAVPEPKAWLLMALGLIGLNLRRRQTVD